MINSITAHKVPPLRCTPPPAAGSVTERVRSCAVLLRECITSFHLAFSVCFLHFLFNLTCSFHPPPPQVRLQGPLKKRKAQLSVHLLSPKELEAQGFAIKSACALKSPAPEKDGRQEQFKQKKQERRDDSKTIPMSPSQVSAKS